MKQCSVCLANKPFTEFYNYKASKDGKSYRCKSCDTAARKKWTELNKEKSQASNRGRQLKHKYGITLKDYSEMLGKQENKCAICGATSNNVRGQRTDWNFAVDHCHTTGDVRGLLCNDCNRALGLFKDSPQILENALKYLEKETH